MRARVRALIDSLEYPLGKAPKLAGPDAYAQRNYMYSLDQALAGEDPSITQHLGFMSDFVRKTGSTLDAFSWHT